MGRNAYAVFLFRGVPLIVASPFVGSKLPLEVKAVLVALSAGYLASSDISLSDVVQSDWD